MLGISLNSSYRYLKDFSTAADYLEYMFGGVQGIAYRATIDPYYRQSYYRAPGLIKEAYCGVKNCFVAMNTFFRDKNIEDGQKGRDVNHLKRLNAHYVDIDCYKNGLSKEAVLDMLEHEYYGSKIPMPTFVIDSGRGLYLIWKLRNEDKKALPRWTRVQQYLFETLEELGADPASKDAARILRVPFSINSKNNTPVKIIDFNDLTYSIYEITKKYEIGAKKEDKVKDPNRVVYPYNEATDKQRRLAIKIAARKGLELPDFSNYLATWDWIALNSRKPLKKANSACETASGIAPAILEGYCNDIKTLLLRRTGGDCKREIGLFIYRHFQYELLGDKEEALKRTLAFNAGLSCPFDEKYVKKVTKSAERKIDKGQGYHYRRDTLVRVLDVTNDELQFLPFFSRKSNASKKERNHRAYLARLKAENKETKKEIRAERQKQIVALQKEGKSASEIQAELEISKATYYRELAAISAKNVVQEVKSVVTEAVEKVTTVVAEVIEKTIKTVNNCVEDCSKNKESGEVSKIQPIIYKRMPKAFCTVGTGASITMVYPDKKTKQGNMYSGKGEQNNETEDEDDPDLDTS